MTQFLNIFNTPRHKRTLAVSNFTLPNFGNFLNKSSGMLKLWKVKALGLQVLGSLAGCGKGMVDWLDKVR